MFSIKRAVEMTGVPAGTLRAWEQRYGIGNPARSDSGYRLYDQRALDEIRQMQRYLEDGWTHQEAAHAIVRNRDVATATPTADASLQGLTDAFIDSTLALDEGALNSVLDNAFSRGTFEFVTDSWLMPTLRQLGAEWVAGRMDIASEHFASSAVMRRLSVAFEGTGTNPTAVKLLLGTPAGSSHEMGSLALAVAARRKGVNAVYLGSNVPARAWVDAVQRHGAAAVVISVVMDADVEPAQETVQMLLQHCPGVLIAVGGAAAIGVTNATVTLTGGISEAARSVAELVRPRN